MTQQTEVLGLEEREAGWRVAAVLSLDDLIDFIPRLIRFVGMEPYGMPYVLSFPTPEGKGGVGYQIYHGLVESWVLIGTWPEHGFIRITLASCKPFNPYAVAAWLTKELGPVLREGSFDL